MGHQWFRFYAETLHKPKAQMLPPEIFKAWVNILCIACQNNGRLPDTKDLAFELRSSISETEATVSTLIKASLLDEVKNQHGLTLIPHNWRKRQYKSDCSTERVKRFRNAARNGHETPSESDTESDTDTEKKKDKKEEKKAGLDKPKPAQLPFEEFWTRLKTNPAYQHISLEVELGKMQAWLQLPKNKHRSLTKQFVLNWLNKIESPVTLNGHRNQPCTSRQPVDGRLRDCGKPSTTTVGSRPLCAECYADYQARQKVRA